jgi:quinol monooxygenase YgiN
MTSLYLVAEIYPHPDKHDQARAALKKLVEETQKEAGCEMYELVAEQGSGSWFMLEKWRSKHDWELHMTTNHIREIQESSSEYLLKPADLRFFDPIF